MARSFERHLDLLLGGSPEQIALPQIPEFSSQDFRKGGKYYGLQQRVADKCNVPQAIVSFLLQHHASIFRILRTLREEMRRVDQQRQQRHQEFGTSK